MRILSGERSDDRDEGPGGGFEIDGLCLLAHVGHSQDHSMAALLPIAATYAVKIGVSRSKLL